MQDPLRGGAFLLSTSGSRSVSPMGTHPGDQASHPRRLRLNGVLPLEVWDVLTGDSILSDHMYAADFPQLLADTLLALRAGRARTRSGQGHPDVCRDFNFAFIGWGLARRPGLVEALPRTS